MKRRPLQSALLALLLIAPSISGAPAGTPSNVPDAWERSQASGILLWGADTAGGGPFVFPDPDNPSAIIGFEIEIMERIGEKLGLRPQLVVVPWDQLVPALQRGDFDLAFNGLEITPERREVIDFTIPYYYFSEQITVRRGTTGITTFDDLRGRRVGTLSATLAQNLMDADGRITVVAYPSPVEAYKDLEIGRIEAVLMDLPIAAFYAAPNPLLENVGEPVGEGIYAGGVRRDSGRLRSEVDRVLGELAAEGELERIFTKWKMWSRLNAEKLASRADTAPIVGGSRAGEVADRSIGKYLPLLLLGAVNTVILSVSSMILAVLVGFLLCIARLYGGVVLRTAANVYIEVIRGTPLLIQLLLLYYGLPNIGIQLDAYVAAVLGVGLNYAAYEAEIYRAGLLSVPKGQDEAARSLGMSGRQSLWYVLLPQALRTILPPSTSDFIALFKDTSLVSIITVTELTRVYSQAATTSYRFLELGLLTALLYFAMSFPLSLWSRSLERRARVALH